MHPPRFTAELASGRVEGVTAIVQNAEPFTYFGERPVGAGEGASLESGDLAGVVLRRARPHDMPTIVWRMLARRAHLGRHRHVEPFSGTGTIRVSSLDERPLPLQVDGDYIGKAAEAEFTAAPGSLTVVA